MRLMKKGMNLHLLNAVHFNEYCWYTLHSIPHTPIDLLLKIRICTANQNLPLFENLLLKRIDYNKKIIKRLRIKLMPIKLSACYIQSMKITRSLCKKVINDQKCQFFYLHLVHHHVTYIAWKWWNIREAMRSMCDSSHAYVMPKPPMFSVICIPTHLNFCNCRYWNLMRFNEAWTHEDGITIIIHKLQQSCFDL